ncbi:MAG: hypothetical protein DMG35_14550 [Acidobacteria bacterium]|nr:MAG: hypothetical protein AUH86_23920 [Acidobacteria bacterium 13_1_40CM_4_58_4]PYT59408.1 MAG: hypothetical protein DMG35_14550 [Acidobacteriota bacterium]
MALPRNPRGNCCDSQRTRKLREFHHCRYNQVWSELLPTVWRGQVAGDPVIFAASWGHASSNVVLEVAKAEKRGSPEFQRDKSAEDLKRRQAR